VLLSHSGSHRVAVVCVFEDHGYHCNTMIEDCCITWCACLLLTDTGSHCREGGSDWVFLSGWWYTEIVYPLADSRRVTLFNQDKRLTLWLLTLLPYAIKDPVPDRVKPSFVIFDIWTLWRLATLGVKRLSYTASEMENLLVHWTKLSVQWRRFTPFANLLMVFSLCQM